MKLIFSAITFGGLTLLWFVNSGYQSISFLNNIGTEKYSKHEIATSTAVQKVTSFLSSVLPDDTKALAEDIDEPKIVTHIQTPKDVRAIYMSSWVASAPSIRSRLVKMIEETEINAVVIDVKDNTGVVSWDGRVNDLESFLEELHSKNIYTIARIAAFQDPLYVKSHPEQAVLSKSTGEIWKDHKGMPWVDTGSVDMWKYLDEISKKAYRIGFDEINLDYIRFPTDGALSDMIFPISGDRAKTDKVGIVSDFYRFITDSLHKEGIPVSGDIFGIVMVTKVDIPTLGQDVHTALQTFDYVAPMIYPSHFYKGTAGYDNPAKYPAEIITFSMQKGLAIADEVASSTRQSTTTVRAKFRPWYQDFDMGVPYTADMVRAQIRAGEILGVNSWMLWDPSNRYTPEALKTE